MRLPTDVCRRYRGLVGFAMTLWLLAFSTLAFALEPTDKWEGPFDYAATGGTFLEDTCAAGPFGCVPGILDGQGDQITSTSTAELYGIPADVQVVRAYLVWMGSIEHGTGTPHNQVTLIPPQGGPNPIVAQPEDLEEISYRDYDADDREAWFRYYTYRVDVTDIIRRHSVTEGKPLNGSYTVSNFAGYAGEPYLKRQVVVGGWSIVMVYSIPETPGSPVDPKRIYLYTIFAKARNEVLALTPSGFLAPQGASAKMTLFVGEGDDSISGMGLDGNFSEQLRFNGTPLFDSCNPIDNVFNSTVNTNLPPSAGNCRQNVYSVDLDTFFISDDLLKMGDTDAEVEISVGQDLVITNYIILSISTKRPDFDIPNEPEKTASVPSGDSLYPGQTFTYYIHVENNGDDVATKVRVRDELPSVVEYVPGTTVVVEPNSDRRQVPDGPGGSAPCLTGIDIVDSMPPGRAYRRTVEIGVRLKTEAQGVTKETLVENTAEIISGRGDAYYTNGGIPVMHRVQLESFEGTLHFNKGPRHPDSRFIAPGDTDVVAAHINLKALDGPVFLSNFAFTPVEGGNHQIITQARLYWDRNSNGVVDDVDVALGDSQTWGIGGLIFGNFAGVGQIAVNSQVNLLLVVDIAENAPGGSMVQLQLRDSDVNVRGFKSGLPFACGRLFIPGEDVGLSMEPGFNNPPSGYLAQGAEATVMQLKLRAYADPVTINRLSFGAMGTVYDPSEVEQAVLILDANGNGVYDSGETELGSPVTFSSDDARFGFDAGLSLEAGETAHVALVVAFSANVGEEKTYRVKIDSNSDVDAGSAGVAGAPIEGSLFTFTSLVQDCTNNNECRDSLGPNWYCDLLAGICRSGGAQPDGDEPDGDFPDGDEPDGDEPDGDEKDDTSGGGCRHGGLPAGLLLLALLIGSGVLRRVRT